MAWKMGIGNQSEVQIQKLLILSIAMGQSVSELAGGGIINRSTKGSVAYNVAKQRLYYEAVRWNIEVGPCRSSKTTSYGQVSRPLAKSRHEFKTIIMSSVEVT